MFLLIKILMSSIVLPPPMESLSNFNVAASSKITETPSREELIKRLREKCAAKNRGRGPAKDALASQLTQTLGSSEAGHNDACPQLIQTLLAKMGTKKVRRNPLSFAKKVLASLVQSASTTSTVTTSAPATQITMVPSPSNLANHSNPAGIVAASSTPPLDENVASIPVESPVENTVDKSVPNPDAKPITRQRRRGNRRRAPVLQTAVQWSQAQL